MSVQLVVDMNLSIDWVAELARGGWSAIHWSTVGDPCADDSVIMAWALANGYVVFTQTSIQA
jgi:predicted nuclease of predicted toxin-antitoxin system